MIKPAQKNQIRIERRSLTQAGITHPCSPWDMDPRTGDKILIRATGCVQGQESVEASFEVEIVPTAEMERKKLWHSSAEIERPPIVIPVMLTDTILEVRRFARLIHAGQCGV